MNQEGRNPMNKCVECQETLKQPGQAPICHKCKQEKLEYKIDMLGVKEANGNTK